MSKGKFYAGILGKRKGESQAKAAAPDQKKVARGGAAPPQEKATRKSGKRTSR